MIIINRNGWQWYEASSPLLLENKQPEQTETMRASQGSVVTASFSCWSQFQLRDGHRNRWNRLNGKFATLPRFHYRESSDRYAGVILSASRQPQRTIRQSLSEFQNWIINLKPALPALPALPVLSIRIEKNKYYRPNPVRLWQLEMNHSALALIHWN